MKLHENFEANQGIGILATADSEGKVNGALSGFVLRLSNAARVMCDREDDLIGLQRNLDLHYCNSHVELIGHEAVFWAKA
jgi:hypothetical protein